MASVFFQSPADARAAAIPKHSGEGGTVSGNDALQSDLQTSIVQMVTDAIQHSDGSLSVARAEAEAFYKGEKPLPADEGRSEVVMTVLRDVVLQMMPSLLRILFGEEAAVEYAPSTKDQIEMAEQVTKFVLDVILQQDNSGFLIYHDWFKDALIKRIGVVKVWADNGTEKRSYTILYQTYDQVTILASDDNVKIDELRRCKTAPPGQVLWDVDYTQTQNWNHIRVACIPPEEYIYTKGARSTDNSPHIPGVAPFVGHRTDLTRSQLRAMNISEDDIDLYAFPDSALDQNPEDIQRQRDGVKVDEQNQREENRKALFIEGYALLALDGDEGINRLYKVNCLGPAYTVIGEPEPCARRPFAVICPDPTPHSIEGSGVSDYTMDLQKIMSAIWRAMLDSLVMTLNPRIAYVEGEASLEDILNVELGAPIRTRSAPANAIQVIEHPFVGQAALPVLDALKQVLKNRVGVDDASSGLDPGALQSTTAMAVAATQSKAQESIEKIARVFAETGIKQMFRMILELMVENPDAERMVKINGTYVPLDPRSWSSNLGVRVNVAIGAGTIAERIGALQESAGSMEQLLQVLGPENPAFSLQQYVEHKQRILKLRGFADASMMWGNSSYQPPPPDPNKQDPNMVIAQAETAKAQADVQKKSAEVEITKQKNEVEHMRKSIDLDLKREEMLLVDQREKDRLAQEERLAIMEMNLKYGAEREAEAARAAAAKQQRTRKVEVTHDETGKVSSLKVHDEGQVPGGGQ
jgi:hypothetical protein